MLKVKTLCQLSHGTKKWKGKKDDLRREKKMGKNEERKTFRAGCRIMDLPSDESVTKLKSRSLVHAKYRRVSSGKWVNWASEWVIS